MSSSRLGNACRAGAIRLLPAIGTLLCLGVASGCARSAASPAAAPPTAGSPADPSPAPSGSSACEPRTAEGDSGPRRRAILDPSEEITPGELSTIPEPVPGASRGMGGIRQRAPLPMAQTAPEADSRARDAGSWRDGPLWRVQVFATQDRALADRMAEETAALLHVSAHVAYETPLYKVRLGDYGSEEAAGPLRDRAVQSGFPGAFRIRCAREATNNPD